MQAAPVAGAPTASQSSATRGLVFQYPARALLEAERKAKAQLQAAYRFAGVEGEQPKVPTTADAQFVLDSLREEHGETLRGKNKVAASKADTARRLLLSIEEYSQGRNAQVREEGDRLIVHALSTIAEFVGEDEMTGSIEQLAGEGGAISCGSISTGSCTGCSGEETCHSRVQTLHFPDAPVVATAEG